jgi:hypothetical protein
MNLKLRRLVRTPSSEQYALFDLDRLDENGDPSSVGKIDLHFVQEGMYGTFLIWEQAAKRIARKDLKAIATAILMELCEPMGLPAEYAVEIFCPSLDDYELLTNASDETAGGEA